MWEVRGLGAHGRVLGAAFPLVLLSDGGVFLAVQSTLGRRISGVGLGPCRRGSFGRRGFAVVVERCLGLRAGSLTPPSRFYWRGWSGAEQCAFLLSCNRVQLARLGEQFFGAGHGG